MCSIAPPSAATQSSRLTSPPPLRHHANAPAKVEKKEGEPDKDPDLTPGTRAIATSPLRVDDLVASPDGHKLAFVSNAINHRQEKYEDVEIYTIDLTNVAGASSSANAALQQPHRVTRNEAEEGRPQWANDSRHIFFSVGVGRRLRTLPRPAAAPLLGRHRIG